MPARAPVRDTLTVTRRAPACAESSSNRASGAEATVAPSAATEYPCG